MVELKLPAWSQVFFAVLLVTALPTRGEEPLAIVEEPLGIGQEQFGIVGDVPANATVSKFLTPAGTLIWQIPETPDVTMDFGSAGYGGDSLVDTPPTTYPFTVPVTCRGSGDDVPTIQAAITTVGRRDPTNGLRGAVMLSGTCFIGASSVININVGGVVLGSTSNARLVVQGSRPRNESTPVILVGQNPGSLRKLDTSVKYKVADTYVQSGASTFNLAPGHNLNRGDKVSVIKSLTKEWAAAMKWSVKNGTQYVWDYSCKKQSTTSAPCPKQDDLIVWERKVAVVSGNRITLDAPISDNLDTRYGTAWVARNDDTLGRIQNVGIVGLTASAGNTYSKTEADLDNERSNYFLTMDNVQNAWASNLILQDFNTAVFLDYGARFITIRNVQSTSKVAWPGSGARPLEYVTRGQQTLMSDIRSQVQNTYSFVTKARAPGPNVFLRVNSPNNSPAEPHMLWATGVLIDSASGAAPSFINRADSGKDRGGHGWGVGYGLIWNGDFRTPNPGKDTRGVVIQLEKPPQGNNLAIHVQANEKKVICWLKSNPCILGYPVWYNPSNPPQPPSLYEAQAANRKRNLAG